MTGTALPQTGMQLETSSFLGTTVCPYNTNLTSGGSSGGEAALMAMKGSCLGVGTDIGGSVRSVRISSLTLHWYKVGKVR
jgi:amidase